MQTFNQNVKNGQGGFTLIETLIYLGLFSIIIGGGLVAAYGIFESSAHNQAKAMVQEEGTYLSGKIDWALSGVKTISAPLLGAQSSSLSVVKYDNALVSITLPPGGVMLLQKGVTSYPLNNTNTEVSALVFTHTGSTGDGITPEGITASFTISARSPNGMVFTQSFSTTKYLRK